MSESELPLSRRATAGSTSVTQRSDTSESSPKSFDSFGAGSDFIWQAIGAIGYDFHLWRATATIGLGAQALSQDFEDGSFKWDVTQFGPLLTLGFRF